MRYSLVKVFAESQDGKVSGTWVEDVDGTIEDALRRAKAVEQASVSSIQVAVVERLGSSGYDLTFGMKKLC